MERKLFTALQGEHAQKLNDTLSKQGFRRSQNVLYRPSCAECSACLSARIRVADFAPSRGHRRILKKAAELRRNADRLDPARPVLVYCAGGWRSSVGASYLRQQGFADVSDILGGFTAWEATRVPSGA